MRAILATMILDSPALLLVESLATASCLVLRIDFQVISVDMMTLVYIQLAKDYYVKYMVYYQNK